jgi:hypothetical protein
MFLAVRIVSPFEPRLLLGRSPCLLHVDSIPEDVDLS